MKRKNAFIVVARLVGLFGVSGMLKCSLSNTGEGVLAVGRTFYLDAAGERTITLAAMRRHHTRWVIGLQGVESVEAAQPFVGVELYLPREQIELNEGEYLDDDLVGLPLRDEQGRTCGTVAEVQHHPSQDFLVVEPGHALVPMVKAFIQKIDLKQGHIVVSLPEGLLNPSDAEEA
jgi:16S rRNA processing protein RimM